MEIWKNFYLVMAVEWKRVFHLPSMWLAAIFSALSGFIVSNPAFFFTIIINYFPATDRWIYATLFGLFTLSLIGATRLLALVREDDAANHQGE